MAKPTRRGRRPASPEKTQATDDVDELRRYHAELGEILQQYDAQRSPFDRVSRHFRRHLPLYALATVWALMIVIVPTVNDRSATRAGSIAESGASSVQDFKAGPGSDITDQTVVTGTGATGGTDVVSMSIDTTKPIGKIAVGTGVTRGGFACKADVRQIPWSTYANPCVAGFTGNNGGKTYRGVTEKTIRVAIRETAVNPGKLTDEQDRAAGRAGRAEAMALMKKYAGYFDKTMELYGRTLEFVMFDSKVSNGIEEAQSRGEEGACADATDIAEDLKAFAVVGYAATLTTSQPFSDCGAERGLFMPFGSSYFPEKWYRERWHPYVWHVYMECERIGHDIAEYVGKRLLNRKAKWALDDLYKSQKRVFGTYVPDNDGYQRCVNIFEQDFKNTYGGEIEHRFDYALEVQRFPEQAERAVVQFKAAGVTTLINACDNLSTRFMTEAADRQKWGPEWYIIGVDRQDTDGTARTFKQNIVDGHLFGVSQLGQSRLIEGKDGEAYRTWKTAFPKDPTPVGFGDTYYRTLALYVMLQAAGPILTPQNIALGLRAMPDGGGAHGAFGTWSFKGDHTAIDDSREIYWVGNATGFDGGKGAYIESYGGRRFRSGEWPSEEPPIYPKQS